MLPEFPEFWGGQKLIPALSAAVQLGFEVLAARTPAALAVTVSFALIAWGLRTVTKSGALAGAAVTYVVFVAMGMGGFLAVLTLFVLTFIATRFGYAQKERLGAVQADGRTAGQVLANLGAAAICCGPAVFFPNSRTVLFVGACSALAEAAGDTMSSEIGQAFRTRAYLITTFEPVSVGQNGGVSLVGTVAGLIGCFAVAFACFWLELVPARWFILVAASGALGMTVDSILGATLERPGRLGNNSVNFVSTVAAAFFGTLLSFVLR